MKTILIPTDFSPSSYTQVERLLENMTDDKKIRLVFFHAFNMPGSEQEVLSKPHLAVLSESFRKNCCKLKDSYSALTEVCYRHFYGSSRRLLHQFLEHNKVDAIFIPEAMHLIRTHEQSIDVSTLLINSGLPILETSVEQFRLRIAHSGALVTSPVESLIS